MDAKGFRHHELRLINVVPPEYEESYGCQNNNHKKDSAK